MCGRAWLSAACLRCHPPGCSTQHRPPVQPAGARTPSPSLHGGRAQHSSARAWQIEECSCTHTTAPPLLPQTRTPHTPPHPPQRLQPTRAVENDDVASAFSLQDLLFLHSLCGVPLVFDFHHHKVGLATHEGQMDAQLPTWHAAPLMPPASPLACLPAGCACASLAPRRRTVVRLVAIPLWNQAAVQSPAACLP